MWKDNQLIEKTVKETMEGLGFEIKEVKEMNVNELKSIEIMSNKDS